MARADATVNEVRSCLWEEIGEFFFVSKFFSLLLSLSTASSRSARQGVQKWIA